MEEIDTQQSNLSISHGDDFSAALKSPSLSAVLERAASFSTGIMAIASGEGLNYSSPNFVSYSQLKIKAQYILGGLRQRGLQPGDKVILYLQDTQNFFACIWGCWLGGFVPIPLGVELSFQRAKIERVQLSTSGIVISDRSWEISTVKVEDLLASQPEDNYYDLQLEDLGLLLFTSGSTGQPKGVMLSASNLLASVDGMARVNNLSQSDICLNWMPVEHIASLVMFHLTQIYLGCEQIQVKSEIILKNPLTWLDLIDQYRVTATWSPNFAYNLVNEKLIANLGQQSSQWDLSCLRWMGNGAEAVVGKTTQRFLELLAPYGLKPNVVSPGYGMSETTSGISHNNQFNRDLNGDSVSVGKPIPGISLRIVDQSDRLVPEKTIGLLQVKGKTVTKGYYQQPKLNQEVFTKDGWFKTGDLGFISAGKLTITGRQQETIIINGVNYYNHEIETVVEAIASVNVSYTAACGVKDSQQQEQVAIFFNTDCQADKLRELINQIRKAVFEQIGVSPRYIIPVTPEAIPKTAIGKIQRSQLAKRFAAGEFTKIIAAVNELSNNRSLSQQELANNATEQKLVAIWQGVLKLATVGVKDNFFELGGNSLRLMQVLDQLTAEYDLSAVDLFQYPTIAALASYLNCDRESAARQQGIQRGLRRKQIVNQDVAIIGMSCRFPGANNLEQFWDNLCHGVESISYFEDEEILNAGVDRDLLNHPDYVKASPILEQIENFDAEFWGYSPKEAQLLDPQQRLFMECAWESLEDAGYDPLSYQGDISLYGGAATNTYLLNNIYPHRHHLDEQNDLQIVNLSSIGGFQVSTANDKDYLTTRTSYKLNLKGSSINVQTACSTSLVTVHLACQSLINSECDLALAGGVSVHSPQKMGYLHQEGMILSADGHCKAFDAAASGTIFGSGAGMVVLKLLDRAIADGDRIYSVIKGTAVNNDGGTKVGYFAPNVDGQTRVVAEALAYADISPESIGYIEAHGTGTKLGDPIEIKALSQAYQRDLKNNLKKTATCAVGSVKTNVGHLQMASGIVGLIKTVLCLDRQKIVPTLHFNRPNPQLNLDRSPFYINTQLQDWHRHDFPRRAGVNSLGIGGTNAHVILEEYGRGEDKREPELPAYLLTLSAKNIAALEGTVSNYLDYLTSLDEASIRNICFTSNVGRHHFDYRLGIVASNKQELIEALQKSAVNQIKTNQVKTNKVAWLFTGQGSQYLGMAQQLYDTCTVFKDNCDRCFEILQINFFRQDIDFDRPAYAQPFLFTIEYSLAQLWLAWGIKPDVMSGHSIGEYVAATIAEVFSLEDALKLISARGKLMQSLPENGAMLAVFGKIPPGLLELDLKLDHSVCLAADNGSHLVLSGLSSEISEIADRLAAKGIETKLLKVAHGFHSGLMQPIVTEFRKVASTVIYNLPQIPIVSNLTGELATEYIASAEYWIQHILEPVQFANGIKYLDRQKVSIFLEIGTKPTLTAIAKDILSNNSDHKLFLHSLSLNQADWQNVLKTLSQLYVAGLAIDWQTVVQDYHGHKISLPTYPFQRQRYWFDLPRVSTEKHFAKNTKIIHPLLGQPLSSPLKQTIFAAYLQIDTHVWLKDHVIRNEIIFPGTAYLEMAIALGLDRYHSQELLLENISIVAPLKLTANVEQIYEQIPEIQTIASPQADSWSWEIYSSQADNWQLHCSGKVSPLKQAISGEKLAKIQAKFSNQLNIQQHYQDCSQKGISYGQSFQSIKQLWAKDRQALGLVELPNYLDSQQYHFHPALLDACLQILFAALPAVQTDTYIPVGVDRLLINSLPDTKVWSYLELKPIGNEQILIADVWLYSATGDLVAKLAGLKSQAVKSQAVKSQRINQPWHNWLYQPQWLAKPLAAGNSSITSEIETSITGTWLIFTDSTGIGNQLARLLQPQPCRMITRADIADNPAAEPIILQQVIQQQDLAGIIYLWSLEQEDLAQENPNLDNWRSSQSYLYLVQALVQHGDHPPLWFVTRNAQPVADYQITLGIYQSCLWGMQKAIALEHPELSCIGIDCDFSIDNEADLIFQEISAGENEQVGYRHNQRYVARLANSQDIVGANGYLLTSSTVGESENYQLTINCPGNLDSLQWQPVGKKPPQDHEIAMEVKATGLNFRDVMVALDLYPDETKFLGLECAGIVTQVGKAVTNFQVGDQVIAISNQSFRQYLTVDALLAIPKPISWSYAEAATIPVTFLTAYYTLIHLAQLQPGQKVLIHSAAGGVGLAAIQIAQHIGAEIFATASPPKWKLLKSWGITKIMNSRDLNFAEEIISLTNGKGVDVVLNSLAGEFIPKSIAVLNPQGSFLEIGKPGIWSKAEVTKIKPDLNYQVVDLWQITQENPALIQQMLATLLDRFTIGKLKPLPHTIFKSDRKNSSPINAFRYMQQGKHQGKIVVTAGSQTPKSSVPNSFSGTYLITGGMGAIGLKVAQWLITKGVNHIVLLGRGEVKPELKDELAEIKTKAQIKLIQADVSNIDQLAQTLRQIETTLPAPKGVIHCAGVKCDRAIINQDWSSFQAVLAPKVQGAWNLHFLTQKYDLECFMMFSSAASLIGSAGQANYCAANAFLDALAHGRRQMGLPGISINWSAWENTGLAADTAITANLQQQGIGSIEPTLGIQILEQLLVAAPAQIGVIPIDWNIWHGHHQNMTPFFEDFIAKNKHLTAKSNLKDQLSAINQPKRKNLIIEQICQYLSQILGLKATQIDLELGFFDLGLDSLTSVELRNKIQSGYDLKLPTTVLFDYGNVNRLADHILLLLFGDNPTPLSQTNQDQNLTTIANLSEAEAADLLLAELDNLEI